MSRYSVETSIAIWNDDSGERVEVGPDRDALDLIEIRQLNGDGKIECRMTFQKEQAALIADAIKSLITSEGK